MDTYYEIALKYMPQNTFDDKSALIQVMACCRQATSYYLNQCWPGGWTYVAIRRHKAT